MVLDALQAVAKHFCEQTAVWRERLEETGLQGEADIPLSLPTGSRLVMILGVWLDGNRLARCEDVRPLTPEELRQARRDGPTSARCREDEP